MKQEIRMLLAQAMRHERLGASSYTWEGLTDEGREFWALRADQMIRFLDSHGVCLSFKGEPSPTKPPVSPVIYTIRDRNPSVDRSIRAGAEAWEIVDHNRQTDAEKVRLTFALRDVDRECELVLAGDPSVPEIPGLRTRIAAAAIIYSLDAQSMAAGFGEGS